MTSSLEDISRQVRSYIMSEFLADEDPAFLEDSTPLISGGILDSIATAKLVSHLEDHYGVRFQAHEVGAQKLDSIDRIAAIVKEKLGS